MMPDAYDDDDDDTGMPMMTGRIIPFTPYL
jgi:hypothetical protein